MKFHYQKAFEDGRYVRFGTMPDRFCCEGMREAISGGAIAAGDWDSSMLSRSKDVNIVSVSNYPEGATGTSFPIKFCPFCAESIETEELTQK